MNHIFLMIFSLTLPFRMCMSLLEKKITMESAYTLLQPYLSSGTGTQGMMDFKQLLDEVFVISGIIVNGQGKCYQLSRSPRLITLTKTLN